MPDAVAAARLMLLPVLCFADGSLIDPSLRMASPIELRMRRRRA